MKARMLFLLKFFAIFLALQSVIVAAPLSSLNSWIAGFEASALNLESKGNAVFAGNASYIITNSCTGLISGSILAAVVFSLKKPDPKKKTAVFAFGAFVLFAVNLLRVYIVILGGTLYGFGFAEALHVASWFAMSALIVALWYYLTKNWAEIRDFSELMYGKTSNKKK